MSSPFVSGQFNTKELNKPQSALPATQINPFQRAAAMIPMRGSQAVAPVTAGFGGGKKRTNPFLSAMNTDSDEFQDTYGVNRPLPEAAFFGFHQGRELRGGARLFLLY